MRKRQRIPVPVSRHFIFLVNYIFGWPFGNLFLTGNAKRQKAVKGKRKVKDEDQGGKGRRQSGKKNKRSKGNSERRGGGGTM